MSEGLEFAVPLRPEELLEAQGTYSATEIDVEEASSQLDGVVDHLCDHAVNIVNSSNFDVLFALIRSYAELSHSSKSRVLDILMSGLSCLSAHIDLVFAGDSSDANEIKNARNAVKMHVFLLKMIISFAEKEDTDAADAKMPTARGPKGAAKSKATKSKGAHVDMWQWETLRPKLLSTLFNVMQADLPRLWSPAKPDERFCSLFVQSAMVALSSVAGCKDKDSRSQALKILLSSSSKYDQRVNIVTSSCDLMYMEHASVAMAELVATAHASSLNDLVADIMNEIGKIPMAELARDSGAAKSVSAFITDVADLCPTVILMHMEALSPHLQSGESYLMRNAIVHAIGRALVLLGTMIRQERSETAVQTREGLLQILRERMLDVNAFTRSKVLQVWAHLCENDAIPKKSQPMCVVLATARLEDKSAQVRKSAIHLLRLLVQKNPYAHTLPLSVFKNKLSDAQEALAAAENAPIASVQGPAADEDEAAEDVGQKAGDEGEVDGNKEEGDKEDEAGSEDGKDEAEVSIEEEGGKAPVEGEGESDGKAKDDAEVAMLQSRVNFYQAAVQFVSTLHKAVDVIEALLRSKTTSDVNEAIDFLVAVFPFQMEVAEQSVRKMLMLVWSKEQSIKESVADAYSTIFLSPLATDSSKTKIAVTAERLCELVRGASVGELASLENIMGELAKSKQLPHALLFHLWELFAVNKNTEAATLLSLTVAEVPALFGPKLRALTLCKDVDAILGQPVLARCFFVMWERLTSRASISAEESDALSHFTSSLIMDEGGAGDDRWLPAIEQAINTICALHQSPQVPLGNVVRSLLVQSLARGATTCEPWRLARLFFCGGHVAIKLLACVEGVAAEQSRASSDAPQKVAASKKKSGKGKAEEEEEEDDLQSAMGPADAAVQESRAEIAREYGERDLEHVDNLVGLFRPLLRQVCLNASGKYGDSRLRSAAILSLCKFMCVSAECCEENLQLLFSIMVSDPVPSIRSNIVIALGDMAFRWTNLTEPWMPHIYALLRDKDVHVRHNALTVLTHLVLNDMVKVRGQVSEMALCLEDEEERIQDMAGLFLSEFRLKQQGNLLYNLLPDMIGRLSADEIDEGAFRRVVKFVFSFIDKAKQTDGLIDKLCQRFRSTDNVRQWQDVAFCLSQLNYSEKSVKKLCDEGNLKTYADKLTDDNVYNSFAAIVAKAKKLPKGSDGKSVADELDSKISAAREKGMAAVQDVTASEAGDGGAQAAAPPRRAPAKGAKKPAAKKGRSKKVASSDEEDEEDEEPVEKKVSKRGVASKKPPAKSRGKKAASSEDEVDDDDSESEEESSKENAVSNRAKEQGGAQKVPASRSGRASRATAR